MIIGLNNRFKTVIYLFWSYSFWGFRTFGHFFGPPVFYLFSPLGLVYGPSSLWRITRKQIKIVPTLKNSCGHSIFETNMSKVLYCWGHNFKTLHLNMCISTCFWVRTHLRADWNTFFWPLSVIILSFNIFFFLSYKKDTIKDKKMSKNVQKVFPVLTHPKAVRNTQHSLLHLP